MRRVVVCGVRLWGGCELSRDLFVQLLLPLRTIFLEGLVRNDFDFRLNTYWSLHSLIGQDVKFILAHLAEILSENIEQPSLLFTNLIRESVYSQG